MKKLILVALTATALIGVTSSANAESMLLQENDFVGITFWLVSMSLLAATAFFFFERNTVAPIWRTSITVAGLVTGVAFVHYLYMRGIWVNTGETPTVYRYIDWLITMPLLTIEFYLILTVVKKVPRSMFWRLLTASLIMLIGRYMGESNMISAGFGFFIGMVAWIYIIYEIFSGQTAKAASASGNKSVKTAFAAMRMIVTVGWAIYPLGYLFGPVIGVANPNALNVIYNLGDLVNKIAFGLIIWSCAMQNTSVSKR